MLKRALNPMSGFVRDELAKAGLLAVYEARPPYQRNDYLGWIASPKQEATRRKRLAQMLDELRRGDVYMNMAWTAGGKH